MYLLPSPPSGAAAVVIPGESVTSTVALPVQLLEKSNSQNAIFFMASALIGALVLLTIACSRSSE